MISVRIHPIFNHLPAIALLASCACCQGQVNGETSDLSVAGIRQALAAEHALIAAHPKDPTNYINFAYTLTDAGMGDQARATIAEATRLAPRSAFVFNAQAWVLRHNSIGVEYGSGFDYEGSLRASLTSIELDPRVLDARESLAEMLEHDRQGLRYGPGADLSHAIDARRFVKQHQSPVQDSTEDDLAILLFYAGRYEEALSELAHYPASTKREGIVLASIAASKDSPTAIALSRQIGGDEQIRKDALTMAAEGLWNMRLYPQAADLLTASLPNASEGNAISAKIQLFRTLRPYQPEDLPASDPRRPVQQLLVAAFTGTLSESLLQDTLSQHSYPSRKDWQSAALHLSTVFAGGLDNLMKQTGLPRKVLADLVLSTVKLTVTSADPSGASLAVQGIGPSRIPFFAVPEDGTYRIAATGQDTGQVGHQALFLLAGNKLASATSLLNWKRTLEDPARSEDPLAGQLFTRLWNPAPADPQTAFLAAASLLNDPSALGSVLPRIVTARESATTETQRTNLDLLLASVYLTLQDGPHARPVTERLLKQSPDSPTALRLAGRAFGISQDWPAWKALLSSRLQSHPGERDLLLESIAEAIAEGDYTRARKTYQAILEDPHSTSDDNNLYAWLSLFEGKPDEQALAAAQQASLAASNQNYAYLHTLACVNAARGNTAEAHQELLDAMTSGRLDQPNAAIWLGFGLIDEQYGVKEAAIAAYRQVLQGEQPSAPSSPLQPGPASSTRLAQLRLKALQAN